MPSEAVASAGVERREREAGEAHNQSAVATGRRRGWTRRHAEGHLVAPGGERFVRAEVVGGDVLTPIDVLAPVHDPAAAGGIRTALRALGTRQGG